MCPSFWQLKNFNHHLTYPHCRMATKIFSIVERGGGLCYHFGKNKNSSPPLFPCWVTEEFQSPSNGVGVWDGDQNSSITIRHTFIVWWWSKFVNHHKGGRSNFYSCTSLWWLTIFNHHKGATEIFWLPRVTWLNFFGRPLMETKNFWSP
jgi:hypothetical protein